MTQSIDPPAETVELHLEPAYTSMAFTPELSKGILSTDVQLTNGAPVGIFGLYLGDFASGSYQWVSDVPTGEEPYEEGYDVEVEASSPDLSHVLYFAAGYYEWLEGEAKSILPLVANNGKVMETSCGRIGRQ